MHGVRTYPLAPSAAPFVTTGEVLADIACFNALPLAVRTRTVHDQGELVACDPERRSGFHALGDFHVVIILSPDRTRLALVEAFMSGEHMEHMVRCMVTRARPVAKSGLWPD